MRASGGPVCGDASWLLSQDEEQPVRMNLIAAYIGLCAIACINLMFALPREQVSVAVPGCTYSELREMMSTLHLISMEHLIVLNHVALV